MHDIIPVVGEGLHRVEDDPEYDKDGKAQYEAAGRVREIEQYVEQPHEKKLVAFKSNKPGRQKQIGCRYAGDG
jgi:hypothetical protein